MKKQKQYIASNGTEYQIEMLIIKNFIGQGRFFLWRVISTYLTDNPNKVIERDLGWKIRVQGEEDLVGFLQTYEYPIGILLTFGTFSEEHWPRLNEFIDLLFDLMKKEGLELRPHTGSEISIEPEQTEIEYQKNTEIMLINPMEQAHSDDASIDEFTNILPKRKAIRHKWKRAYQIIGSMEDEYFEKHYNDESWNPTVRNKDIKERLAFEMHWKPADATIRKIREAGEKGLLD